MNSLSPPPVRLAWTIWGLGAVLYLTGFYQRVAPAVMTAELMAAFQINAAALGNLSAFYFYSYVAMQVPTGILADAWGPRRLLTAGALICGARPRPWLSPSPAPDECSSRSGRASRTIRVEWIRCVPPGGDEPQPNP
jgi:MFS family permease